jgi:hypothetical protein
MVMVVMVMVAMRGESRRRNRKQERGDKNELLHGKNVARGKSSWPKKSARAP